LAADIRLQKAQMNKVIDQGVVVAIHQVNQSIHQVLLHFLGKLIHHAEIDVGQATIGQGEQVARMGIRVEKAVFQQLLEGSNHPDTHQLFHLQVGCSNALHIRQLDAVDPLQGQNPAGAVSPEGVPSSNS
jgi:hypothetical protein